jgi:RecA/RadA recombinase
MATKKFSFSDLDEKLSKIAPLGSIVTRNTFSKIDEWIPTGNYMLNAQITGSIFGGIPNCRSVLIAGDSGTGKTFLTLNMCRESQHMGYDIIYCDSEAAVDEDIFVKFGMDPERVRYQPVNTIQEFSIFVNNLTKAMRDARKTGAEVPKVMLVLDSLGNLASSKEKEDMISGKGVRDMTKQQIIRSMFRTATVDLAAEKIPFIITNHTYQGIGLFATKEISGGGGAIFNPSIILMLSKAKLSENNEDAKKAEMRSTGIVVTSSPKKNRFARPIPVKFHISFFRGMNKYTGLERYISWESCGIAKGKLISEKEFSKWKPEAQAAFNVEKNSWIEKYTVIDELAGGVEVEKERRWYFLAKETARTMVVKHLNSEISPRELFTPSVITDDLLKEIDEKIIKPLFMLPDITGLDDLAEVADVIEATIDDGDIDSNEE